MVSGISTLYHNFAQPRLILAEKAHIVRLMPVSYTPGSIHAWLS